MAEDLKNKPSYTCAAYADMKPAWQIMEDTCAGTLKLRNADSLTSAYYLPAEPAEKSDHYIYRKRRAIFFNATQRTVHGLVGMVFRKEPKLGDDVPEVIRGREAVKGEDGKETEAKKEGQWENIDLAGSHGSVFCKEVFTDAVRDGHAAILVDMPPELPEGSTLADELATNRRPYWVSYEAKEIINWRTAIVNGKTTLVLIVFKECSKEPDGEYGEKEVTRYRVIRRGDDGKIGWELYRDTKGTVFTENGERVDFILEASGPISLDEIPVAFIYSRKCGTGMSQPPLLDLALINIAHYQKYSDFSIYLHIGSRPQLWFRNRNTQTELQTIGPYTYWDVGEGGHVDYAEPKGTALAAASEDIKDLETRMAALGLAIVEGKSKPQPESTATEEVLDHVREESDLATAARSLKDAMELCLRFHNQYLTPSAKTGGSVELGATIEEMTLSPEEMTFWLNAVTGGLYSAETVWDVFTAAGKTPETFDKKKEQKRIDEAQKKKQDAEIAMMDAQSRNFDRGGAAQE